MLFCCLAEIYVEFAVLRCCELSVFMAGGGVGFYSGDLRTVNQVSIFKIFTIFSLSWHNSNDRQLDFHGTQFTHQMGSEYLIFGCYALQRHNTENSKRIFPEKVLCDLSPNFHIHVSMTGSYIPTIGYAYSAAEKHVDRSWEYINRSQTHECGIWDWGRAIPFLGTHKWDFRCSVCLSNLWVILAGHEGSEADNPARCAAFYQQDLCQVTMWKAWTS